METKIFKKLLVAILIVMLTATDFFMLGSGIISYAVDNLNNSNNTLKIIEIIKILNLLHTLKTKKEKK